MSTELTKISGIGKKAASDLSEAGFNTIDSIANATPDALGKVKGFGAARAARVIATAKEMTQDNVETTEVSPAPEVTASETIKSSVKADPVVTPTIVVAEKESRFAKLRGWVFIPTAAMVFLVVAAIYFGQLTGFETLDSFVKDVQEFATTTTVQEATNETVEQKATDMVIVQDSKNSIESIESNSDADAMNSDLVKSSEPEWVATKRAQANEYRDIQRAKADEYRKVQLAKADKYREESWNRFISSLPAAQAEQVIKQKAHAMKQQAFAEKQMLEAKKRQMAMIQQHNAYIKQRFGG